MLPTQFLEKYLLHASSELREIVLELRNIIVSVAPDAHERMHWNGISYFDANRGGPVSAGICQISVCQDHVRLGFVHGAFLPDPKQLLEGDRKAKRFVRIWSYNDAPWDDLRDLITSSNKFDPYTLSFR
jgi:hypothetical protein